MFLLQPLPRSEAGSARLDRLHHFSPAKVWMQSRTSHIMIQRIKPSFFRLAFWSIPIGSDVQEFLLVYYVLNMAYFSGKWRMTLKLELKTFSGLVYESPNNKLLFLCFVRNCLSVA